MIASRRAIAAIVAASAIAGGCRREAKPAGEPATGVQVPGPAGAAAAYPAPDRPVAAIVSASWDDESARDDAGEAARVLDRLGVREGTRVADVGAGSGYYTIRASRRVGASGHVVAEDIIPSYVDAVRKRVAAEALPNVSVTLGEPHDPRLARGETDVALLVHMYHEVEQPYALLANLAPAIAPAGRVGILDTKRPTGAHGTPPALLACELAAAGYDSVGFDDFGDAGYLAMFRPRPAPAQSPDSVRARVAARPCRQAAP